MMQMNHKLIIKTVMSQNSHIIEPTSLRQHHNFQGLVASIGAVIVHRFMNYKHVLKHTLVTFFNTRLH